MSVADPILAARQRQIRELAHCEAELRAAASTERGARRRLTLARAADARRRLRLLRASIQGPNCASLLDPSPMRAPEPLVTGLLGALAFLGALLAVLFAVLVLGV